MAMLAIVKQCILQLKEVKKLKDLKPGSKHLNVVIFSDCCALARLGNLNEREKGGVSQAGHRPHGGQGH